MPDAAVVSVTEVRNALRCPRIFAIGRQQRNVVAFPVGSSCMGGAFHRIVDRFANTVSTPPPAAVRLGAAATLDERREALVGWILGFLADDLQADPTYATMPAEVDDLAEALRQLAGYLAERASTGPLAESLKTVVREGEHPVEAELTEAGVVLKGRIDALYGRPGDRLEVIEYKLTADDNDGVDQAQVALYRELLKRGRGVVAKAMVLRFNPELGVTELADHRADELVRTKLLPLLKRMGGWASQPETAPATDRKDLCGACPVAKPCAERFPARLGPRDDPPMGGLQLRPQATGALGPAASVTPPTGPQNDAAGLTEAAAIQKRILAELRRDGVGAESGAPVVGPTLYVIPVTKTRGRVGDLDRAADSVLHRLSQPPEAIEASYRKNGAHREFTVQRPNPRTVLLAPLLEAKKQWLLERPGRLVLGQRPDGGIVTADLADAATPHLLIGGQAGSGKSWLLRSIVASLVHWHPPAAIQVTLLDPKRVTFIQGGFKAAIAPHLQGPLLYDVEEALPCLERFAEVMEERYEKFERKQVMDLTEYNQVVPAGERMARQVVVMDEFQDLTADPARAKEFVGVVNRLGAKARAAGVHLILATQRPDAKNVPPVLKANLGGKVALRVASFTNSRIILDAGGAELLVGRGDMLADLGQGLVRAQAAVVGT